MSEGKLLRFAAPKLYGKMSEIFSDYHIHPHDVHARLVNTMNGLEVEIRFTADFSQLIKLPVSPNQVAEPDLEVSGFFKETAKKCKTHLIADYFNMIKP